MLKTTLAAALIIALALTTACGDKNGYDTESDSKQPTSRSAAGSGDDSAGKLEVKVLLDGLQNPSAVYCDSDGSLLVCDTGHGKVIRYRDGKSEDFVTGFDTEYWKIDAKSGAKRFLLGPLSVIKHSTGAYVISDCGKADGADRIMFFTGAGTVADGTATNGIAPTSDDPADKGEGNPCGMVEGPDGKVYACGQGADAKSWILVADPASRKMEPWASADDNGIAVNSPMQLLLWDDEHLLCLYSGAGGKKDGLIVKWSLATKKPVQQWSIDVIDPMGMAKIPGSDDLVVVDNNWALTKVNEGSLVRVSLGEDGKSTATPYADVTLHGPVSCSFGKDDVLYVTQLGKEFDKKMGQLLAVTGIKP